MATSIARLKRGPGTLSGINHVDYTRREYSPEISVFCSPRCAQRACIAWKRILAPKTGGMRTQPRSDTT